VFVISEGGSYLYALRIESENDQPTPNDEGGFWTMNGSTGNYMSVKWKKKTRKQKDDKPGYMGLPQRKC